MLNFVDEYTPNGAGSKGRLQHLDFVLDDQRFGVMGFNPIERILQHFLSVARGIGDDADPDYCRLPAIILINFRGGYVKGVVQLGEHRFQDTAFCFE